MAYQAIYRKWRPLVFDDVVGQQHITETLKNQLESGKIAHAYLFCGTRGTGKTTAAKIFARAVNCKSPKNGSPCNECSVCKGILEESIMDVYEIDAASNNGVDNIREIIDDAKYVATEAKYRVYIIDEVHMLSGGAFNALLKTLEEPPEHVIFILATTEAHKVPQTILSRCQRFDFKRISRQDIIRRMREIAMGDGISVTEDAFELLAQLADGSMRDGLSIMERCISAVGTNLTYEAVTSALGIADNASVFKMAENVAEGNCEGILEIINTLQREGKDLHVFADNLIEHYRNLLVCKVTKNAENLLEKDREEVIKLKDQAERISFEKLSNAVLKLSAARSEAKWIKEPRVIYELALIKLTRPELDPTYDAVLDRLSRCEEKIENGITVKAVEEVKPEKKEPEKVKPAPSARLFAPIDKSTLNASSPLVIAARKWDKVAQNIAKKHPHIAASVINRKITIDGDGIILLFENREMMLKRIAVTFMKQINEEFCHITGGDFQVKAAFLEDIGQENIIDYWKLGAACEEAVEGKDPIDALCDGFSEIVEITDQSDFLEYDAQDDSFEQTEIDEEKEEFLDEDE